MHTSTFTYSHSDTEFEAFIAYDGNTSQKRSIVFILHPWAGRDAFACNKAVEMAEKGYIGIALDVYGKNIIGNTLEEKQALLQPLLDDRALLLKRLLAGINGAQSLKGIDTTNMAAIGYCFGGLCALDLARENADLKAVISVHGLLTPPHTKTVSPMKTSLLLLHGHDDPMVPPSDVLACQTELTEAKADWQMQIFGLTQHAFTNPEANDPNLGAIYNPIADRRASIAIDNFLQEKLNRD